MNRQHHTTPAPLSRREMLMQSGLGIGSLALAGLLAEEGLLAAGQEQGAAQGPHFAGAAQNVIVLFMAGGPSHLDTWDPKPVLSELAGQDVPESIARNLPSIKRVGLKNLWASPFKFAKHGESGIEVSELFPETARLVDELCVIRSMQHTNPVHGPGECVMLTGTQLGDRPSLGAWTTYGLGSENSNLPSFVVMNVHTEGMQYPQAAGWETGFLPARYQGTVVDASRGIRNITMPAGYNAASRQAQLELMGDLNRRHAERVAGHDELEARIRSYEMAFRMQASAPELFDLSQETAETQQLYGADKKPTDTMGRSCLLARRLVESGVRFVQVRCGGWDSHQILERRHRQMAEITDKPVAGLLTDLKRRGLLDNTLVVWGGEFGRTPTMEGIKMGRDHSPNAFTCWLAGGGVQGGQVIGATDPIGYSVTDRPVRPSDFHATLLHATGVDQHKLFHMHHGRKEIATVLGGEVVQEVFGGRRG